MFSFIRKLFRKKPATQPVPAPQPTILAGDPLAPSSTRISGDSQSAIQRVETAQLQLAAIVARFPEDLRKIVLKQPPPEAMVALPLPTILKFLPSGSVRMSLASVVRQSPPGTFAPINVQDKRLVEVPLAEIFKRVSPAVLKRRNDQKYTDLAAEGFDLFGDDENPHAVAPRVVVEEPKPKVAAPPPPEVPVAPPAPAAAPAAAGRVLQMPPGVVTAPPPGAAPTFNRVPAPASPTPKNVPPAPSPAKPAAPAARTPAGQPTTPPPGKPEAAPQKPAAPAAPASDQPPLVMPLGELTSAWPEPFKGDVARVPGASVTLPSALVADGLKKGKVAFTWGELRTWSTPPISAGQGSDAQELVLSLRTLAPAFLKHTKGGGARRNVTLDETIPELFSGGRVAAAAPKSSVMNPPKAPGPASTPAPAPAPDAAPTPKAEPTPAPKATPPPEPAPVPELKLTPPAAPAAESRPEPAPAPAPERATEPKQEATPEPAPAPAPEPKAEAAPAAEPPPKVAEPAPAAPALAPAPALPATIGEALGNAGKAAWSPSEIVNTLTENPLVAGCVIALQEGLVIAHRLPEPFKGEVFAAFLPQVFARINQYAGEMKLGSVDELVIQASGAPCAIFRRGQLYFAVLGRSTAELPMHILRLCADALASQ